MHLARPRTGLLVGLCLTLLLGATAPSVHGQGVPGFAANKCLAGKNKCVSKKIKGLMKCREKCQKSPTKCGQAQTDCEAKVIAKFDGGTNPAKGCFAKLEAKDVPGASPDKVCTTTGDTATMETRVDGVVADLVATLEGNPPPACGDGVANGDESCDGADLAGASCMSLGYASGTLACTAGCGYDVGSCVATTCGNGAIEGDEQCDGGDLGGATCASLGYTAGGTLACDAGCGYDTSGCGCLTCGICGNETVEADEQCDGADLGGATCDSLGYTLGGSLACDAGCGYDTSGCASQAFPATGQMTCWDGDGNVIPCAGTGQDGDVQAGAPLAYQDNGDGTITDLNTGLMWEKKADDGSLHDWNNCYPWRGICTGDGSTKCGRDADCAGVGGTCDTDDCQAGAPNGLTIFEWVDPLNAASFAGYTDWRIPNIRELLSRTNWGTTAGPQPPFHTGCTPGCTVTTCSCAAPQFGVWSATSSALDPNDAWSWNGFAGGPTPKGASPRRVRAVRSGS